MSFGNLFGRRVEEIRGLSVIQPWASLIAIGAKSIETRTWSHPYRGLIAIHASKGFPKASRALCWGDPFRAALIDGGLDAKDEHLPLGAVIAVARLDLVLPSEDIIRAFERSTNPSIGANGAREQAFGDFSAKRFGWFLRDVVPLKEPVPAKGALGLWFFDEQTDALAAIRAQLKAAA